MFEKEKIKELYNRENFSIEEELYDSYKNMRIALNKYENMKYSVEDNIVKSEDFKQGFIAGIKIMSSLLIDL